MICLHVVEQRSPGDKAIIRFYNNFCAATVAPMEAYIHFELCFPVVPLRNSP